MAWVKILQDHDWFPTEFRSPMIAYKAGTTYNVTRDCRDEMIGAGKAANTTDPKKRRRVRRS